MDAVQKVQSCFRAFAVGHTLIEFSLDREAVIDLHFQGLVIPNDRERPQGLSLVIGF